MFLSMSRKFIATSREKTGTKSFWQKHTQKVFVFSILLYSEYIYTKDKDIKAVTNLVTHKELK